LNELLVVEMYNATKTMKPSLPRMFINPAMWLVLCTSRRALLASALVIIALLGPATIQSVEAEPGDGTVQPFTCQLSPPGVGDFQADFVTVPKPFGFGTSDKAIHVVNDGNATATAGCIMKNFKRVSPNRPFQSLQIMFSANVATLKRLFGRQPSKDVLDGPVLEPTIYIGACFDTPTGLINSVETSLIRQQIRRIRGDWFLAEIPAELFFFRNPGTTVKWISLRLFGHGDVLFGDTRINYVGASSDLRPQDPITTPVSCPGFCTGGD
jgi:hypothetical protein